MVGQRERLSFMNWIVVVVVIVEVGLALFGFGAGSHGNIIMSELAKYVASHFEINQFKKVKLATRRSNLSLKLFIRS